MKINEMETWEAFLGVATHGNFSAAALNLRVPLSQVSKRVAKLETQLGARLFQRTTRVVTLTDEGKALLPKIHSIMEDLREAEALFEHRLGLAGKIKVTCPPFVAHNLLLPILSEFMALHPRVHLEIDVSEAFQNIVDSGFDMAIRIQTPKDTDLVYRKLAPNDLVICAAPAYLKKHKAPVKPSDLQNHDLLMLSVHRHVKFRGTAVALGDFAAKKKITCENGAFLVELALQGQGVLVRSIWDAQRHLEQGTLVQVLKKHPLETFGHIHAVVPSSRYLAPRVRAFLDFVVTKAQNWAGSH
jgi:DNA-binding transcriptional LysR family regulator